MNQKFNFKHYFNYFKENFKISLKERLEYKVNFFTSLVYELSDVALVIFFSYIFSNFLGDDLNWHFIDFIILAFFGNLIHIFSGTFWYSKQLNWRIKKGDLNQFLYRPGNKILNYILSKGYNGVIHLIVDIIIYLPFLIILTNFTFLSFIYCLLVSILLIYLFIITFYFLDSWSWHTLEFGKILSQNILEEVNEVLYVNPGSFFKNTNFKYIFFIMPIYFVATIIVPLFQNKSVENLWFQIILIIIICIIFTIITIINWKYGLKKYEAFG